MTFGVTRNTFNFKTTVLKLKQLFAELQNTYKAEVWLSFHKFSDSDKFRPLHYNKSSSCYHNCVFQGLPSIVDRGF